MIWTLIKEFKWCKAYDLDCINVYVGEEAVVILNSHKIKRRKHMKEVIRWIKSYDYCKTVNDISDLALITEWQAHNLLYWLGYQKDRTNNCDLNVESWYNRLIYFILSCFYFGQ